MPSDKQAGARASLFWPSRGLEVGVSYSDTMSGFKHKMLGADFTWVVKRSPLVIRAEAIHSKEAGNAYWAEAACGLQKLSRKTLVRNTQVVFRTEQYFGLNYYLTRDIRLNVAYAARLVLTSGKSARPPPMWPIEPASDLIGVVPAQPGKLLPGT